MYPADKETPSNKVKLKEKNVKPRLYLSDPFSFGLKKRKQHYYAFALEDSFEKFHINPAQACRVKLD